MSRAKPKPNNKKTLVEDLRATGYTLHKEFLRWGTGELYYHPQHRTYRYVTPTIDPQGRLDWRIRNPYEEFMTVLHTWQPTAQADIDWMSTQMLSEFQQINDFPIYSFSEYFSDWGLDLNPFRPLRLAVPRFFGWLKPVDQEDYVLIPGKHIEALEITFKLLPTVRFSSSHRKYLVSDPRTTYLEVY